MQYRNLGVVALAGQALAAYVPSEPWSTLTPSATLAGGLTSYSASFGIAVNPIATTTSSSAVQKNVNKGVATQIDDGQIQDNNKSATLSSKVAITQIGDGQIQATTSTAKATVAAITQIGDGQIQAASKATKAAVTQIGDGQVQAATATTTKATKAAVTQIGDGQVQAATATTTKATKAAVTQIGDGQVQAATTTKSTKAAVTQIGDGQVQADTTTTTAKSTKAAATQIGDGQVQAATTTKATKSGASQVGDGQVQAASTSATTTSATTSTTDEDSTDPVQYQACKESGSLSLTLKDGILVDAKGRIGSIVANRQFQFDGPPPQAGAIYAAGWSISEDGNLAIGNSTTFYQCLSGDFYNLYDEHIGSKCTPVNLNVVELVSC